MINRGRLLLNGYFEKKHRSPVTAAFIVILAAGALYSFLGQLFISMIFFLRGFMTELQQQLKHSDFFTVYKILIEDNKYFFMITTSVFQFTVLLGLTVLLVKKWHTNRWKAYLKYKKFNPLALPLSILGTAAIIPMVLKLNQLYKYFFPVMEKLKSLSRPLFAVNSHFDIILLLLTVCITPAVCEEALFRGYFQRTLERRWKIFIAIPVSGLLFALFHKSPLGLPVLTVVGIYLGLLFYAFDSLWISMFTHLLYNALIIAVTNIPAAQMPLVFNSSGSVKNTVFISSVVTFLLITVLIIILFPGKRHRKSYIKQE